MKQSIFFLLITLPSFQFVFGQEGDSVIIPSNDKGFAEYTEVVTIDSFSKSDLYLNALEWMNKTYKSGKNVIQTTDKDGGMIIGKAITQALTYNNMGAKVNAGYFSYNISIYCKDNKFKYLIDNILYIKGEMNLKSGADLSEKFPHNWTGFLLDNKQTRREWLKFQIIADIELKAIIDDLKKTLKSSRKRSEW